MPHPGYRFLASLIVLAVVAGVQSAGCDGDRPTLFLIGDSTVNTRTQGQLGWGDPIAELFDASKIRVVNRARGGRSSRTYFTEGLWDQVLGELKAGDFVLMQFGHNDRGPLCRGRGPGFP